jgi:hypothetical protein
MGIDKDNKRSRGKEQLEEERSGTVASAHSVLQKMVCAGYISLQFSKNTQFNTRPIVDLTPTADAGTVLGLNKMAEPVMPPVGLIDDSTMFHQTQKPEDNSLVSAFNNMMGFEAILESDMEKVR